MHSRRIACLLLGLWLGAGLWMQWVASQNVSAAETMLLNPSPGAASYMKAVNPSFLAPMARYLAREENRALYDSWGIVQIAFAAILFFMLLFGTRLGKSPIALSLVLLLIVIVERLVLTPEMNMAGRATDFAAESHRAIVIHAAMGYGYTTAEILKWMMSAILAALLIWQHSARSLDSRKEVDLIDKSNYRHVNR